jgi:hypothetical protein
MIRDLFEEDVGDRRLAPEAKLLGGFARRLEAASTTGLIRCTEWSDSWIEGDKF